jgi:hypothetical protein
MMFCYKRACHCEESATKQSPDTGEIASQSLAMTVRQCHCEESATKPSRRDGVAKPRHDSLNWGKSFLHADEKTSHVR